MERRQLHALAWVRVQVQVRVLVAWPQAGQQLQGLQHNLGLVRARVQMLVQ